MLLCQTVMYYIWVDNFLSAPRMCVCASAGSMPEYTDKWHIE